MNRLAFLLLAFAACGDDPKGGDADSDADTDSDTDTTSDSETDSDSDTGSASESDSETGPCDEGADCGVDTDCLRWACIAEECVEVFTDEGTPVGAQIPGDCKRTDCDGKGGVTIENDDGDVPADEGNACTVEACNAGKPVVSNAEPGSPCEDGQFCTSSDACDGAVCVGGANPCPGHDVGPDCTDSCDEVARDCIADDAFATPCSDGLFCTENEVCTFGECRGGTNPCPGDDVGPSCEDSCDEAGGVCEAADAIATPCNEDGDGTVGACNGAAAEPNCIGD